MSQNCMDLIFLDIRDNKFIYHKDLLIGQDSRAFHLLKYIVYLNPNDTDLFKYKNYLLEIKEEERQCYFSKTVSNFTFTTYPHLGSKEGLGYLVIDFLDVLQMNGEI